MTSPRGLRARRRTREEPSPQAIEAKPRRTDILAMRSATTETRPRASAQDHADPRILIVDDQEGNVRLLDGILRGAGYTNLTSTTDPRDVLPLYAEISPDLVLLDLHMPGLDGFAVLELLGGEIPPDSYLPILVLTADITPEAKRRALASGASDFLTKPFDVTEVRLRIANLLQTRSLHLTLQSQNEILEQRVRERTAVVQQAYQREHAAAEQLRALDRMKDVFLTAVSHELRTPLSAILGYAVTLEDAGDRLSADGRRTCASRLAASARKLEGLLADLLDVQRLSQGVIEPTRRPTAIGNVVEEVIRDLSPAAAGRILVDVDPVVVAVDAPQIERIIVNLVTNALKYTPEETPVVVRVREEQGGAMIAVEDGGPGVPEEVRAKIFQPFQRGVEMCEHSPGVGIGLSLVAGFAALHGGKAWVEDRPGGGASFRVFLPNASGGSGDHPGSESQ